MDPQERRPWKRPFAWPPSKWDFTPGLQVASEVITWLIFLCLIITFGSAIIGWLWLIWRIGNELYIDDSENVRNYLLALGALLGVPFLIWITLLSAQQTAINRESLYTQLFTSGVERLGAEKTVKVVDRKPLYQKLDNGDWKRDNEGRPVPALRPDGRPLVEIESYEKTVINREVRLGAVYALERVALDSARDSQSILETLAEFIKNNLPIHADETPDFDEVANHRSAAQAAINVIGRLPSFPKELKARLDLTSCDLTDISLANGKFALISFGNTKIDYASLWDASFDNCDMVGTKLTAHFVREVVFRNCKMYESELALHEVYDTIFKDCIATSASIDSFQSKNLKFMRCNFSRSKWVGNNSLSDGALIGCQFAKADMAGVVFDKLNIQSCSFEHANLMFAHFSDCQISSSSFRGANLAGVTLPFDFDATGAFVLTKDELDEITHEIPDYLKTSKQSLWDAVGRAVMSRWREWANAQKGQDG